MPPAIPVLVCRNCQDLRELMASHAGEVVATKQMMKEQVSKRDVEIEALKQILAKRKHTGTGSTKFSWDSFENVALKSAQEHFLYLLREVRKFRCFSVVWYRYRYSAVPVPVPVPVH